MEYRLWRILESERMRSTEQIKVSDFQICFVFRFTKILLSLQVSERVRPPEASMWRQIGAAPTRNQRVELISNSKNTPNSRNIARIWEISTQSTWKSYNSRRNNCRRPKPDTTKCFDKWSKSKKKKRKWRPNCKARRTKSGSWNTTARICRGSKKSTSRT